MAKRDILTCLLSNLFNCYIGSIGRAPVNSVGNELELKSHKPLGPSSLGGWRFLTGSRILQSVPAQVKSQIQVASLLHTCEEPKTEMGHFHCGLFNDSDKWKRNTGQGRSFKSHLEFSLSLPQVWELDNGRQCIDEIVEWHFSVNYRKKIKRKKILN